MSMMNLPVSRISSTGSYPASPRGGPVPRRQGFPARWLDPAREVALVVLAVITYFLVRGLVDADPALAFAHARSLVDLERSLGLFHEPTWQGWVLQHPLLVDLLNAIYVYGHWPLIALTLGWLFLRQRAAFREIRLAMVLSGLVGFACFFLFPMAPPRFLPDLGFVDTVVLHSDAYRVLQPPSMTNQYAAMPSLHVGWNLLMGIAMVRYASSRLVTPGSSLRVRHAGRDVGGHRPDRQSLPGRWHCRGHHRPHRAGHRSLVGWSSQRVFKW